MKRDQFLITISIIFLFFTMMTNWDFRSWLILFSIILLLVAWYFRSKDED